MLVSTPTDTTAISIPTGVASVDGRTYFVPAGSGIAALDAATGAVAWSTAAANLPVLALPDALLAIRGAVVDDATWSGPGALVAIDLAAPHAARAGAVFDLALERHRLLDARTERGALEAGWISTGGTAAPMAPRTAPVEGTIRFDLAGGGAQITRDAPVPDRVRRELAGATAWLPPWRTRAGWSALVAAPGAAGVEVVLRHWPAVGGAAMVKVVVETARLTSAGALHATERHLFLRVCDPPTAPTSCELRVHDAETGALVHAIADAIAPGPDRLEAPLAVIDRRLLAVQHDLATGDRVLAAIELDHAAAAPSWRRPIARSRALEVQP